MEGGKHPSTIIAGVLFNQLWHKQPGYRQFWKIIDGLLCIAIAAKKK